MEFHLGAQVQQENGSRLGELTRVVYNPETREVDSLVAQSVRMGERELQVPLDVVDVTDDETVGLTLSEEAFESLDEFSSTHNVAPPPDRNFADTDADDELGPGTESPPIGAATGIESIAFIPIVEESLYIPSGEEVMDRSTEVWATDGMVGHVRAVITEDATPRLRELLVRHGTIFTHEVSVPSECIQSMRTDTIVLNVEQSVLDRSESE